MHHPAWASPIGYRHQRSRDALQRIADTLDIPVVTLWDAARSDEYPDEAAELVQLWFKIRDEAKRRTILNMVRRVAGKA